MQQHHKKSATNDDIEQDMTVSVDQCGFCGTTEDLGQVDVTTSDGWVRWACDSCFEEHGLDGGFPSYCCGMIYEEGEFACASCGDPL